MNDSAQEVAFGSATARGVPSRLIYCLEFDGDGIEFE